MSLGMNDTLRVGAPVECAIAPNLTPDMLRIVRRAVRGGGRSSLDLALRAAVARSEPPTLARASQDEELRVQQLAGRLGTLLAPSVLRRAGGCERHRETVRN